MAGDRVKLNTDTNLLKLIAMITMLVDHLGARVFPQYQVMRIIGRIAFPIYAYCVAVGCVYTRNIFKYALRMGVMAMLVQPLYATAMGHTPMMAFDWAHNFYRVDLIIDHYYLSKPSILFTLFAGILLLWTIRDKKYLLTGLMIAVIWYIQNKLDYGLNGILLILLFYVFCDRPLTSFAWVAAFMVWWGVPAIRTRIPDTVPTTVSTQFFALLSLPLIYFPLRTRMKINKYVYYGFYPAHLALIYLLTM